MQSMGRPWPEPMGSSSGDRTQNRETLLFLNLGRCDVAVLAPDEHVESPTKVMSLCSATELHREKPVPLAQPC